MGRPLVLLLAALLALVALGARGIWESDEGRYTAAGARMADTGDWLTPRLDLDRPHLTKPPLTYWTVAASTALLGRSELAARLPNAIAFVLTVLILLELGPSFAPERPWLPALIYATAPATVLGASVVTTDTLLTLFEVAAVWCWWGSRAAGERRWILGMWFAFGLGFLTKGPPALLPLLAIVAFHGLRGERTELGRLFPVSGLAIFTAVALWWFALMVWRDPALAGYFLGHELVDRFASDVHERNPEWYAPFTVYLPVLLGGMLPWLLLPLRGWLAGPWSRRHDWQAAPAAATWPWLWTLLPLAVFCLSQSRQPAYVLPLCAPLALAIGRALAPGFDLARRGPQAVLLVAVGLALALKLWLGQWQHRKDTRALRDALVAQVALAPTDRVLFVERWPQWGLRFYLPIEIGHLDSIAEACGALAPTGRTVLLTRIDRADALTAALAACDAAPKPHPLPYYDARILTATR